MNRTRTLRGLYFSPLMWLLAVGSLALPLAAEAQQVPTVHGLSLYGVPALPADFSHFAYVNPEAPKGGTMVRSVLGSFDSTNPFIITGNSASGMTFLFASLLYDTLLMPNRDEVFTEYGLIASGIRLDPAHRWIEFDIDPRARFSDGTPVTAQDVKFSYELLREQGLPFYRSYYADVTSVELPRPGVVRFELAEHSSRELPLILGQFPILPEHYWQGREFTRPTLDTPLGSGPYRVAQVIPGSRIVYERNPDYWARDLPVNRGRFNPDQIIYDYYRDESVAMEAFLSGQVDMRFETSASRWMTAYTGPAVARGDIQKTMLESGSPAPMQGLVMNLRKPMFQDRRVREALTLAFDFETVNRQFYYGRYQRTRGFFDDSELEAQGLPSALELEVLAPLREGLPAEVFDQPLPDDHGLDRRARLEKALQLLQQAGYRVENFQLVDAEGRPFTFEILLDQIGLQRLALPYARNLARLGIQANVRVVDPSQYQVLLRQHDYDMIRDEFYQSNSPGNEQREFWSSAYADVAQSRNTPGIANPAVDQLIDAIIRADSRERIVARTRALDRVLRQEFYVVPLFHAVGYDLAYWRKLKFPATAPRYGIDLNAWWVDDTTDGTTARGEQN